VPSDDGLKKTVFLGTSVFRWPLNPQRKGEQQMKNLEWHIDELGRIIIPSELRKQLGWNKGDAISFHCDDGKIIVTLSEKNQGQKPKQAAS